MSRGATQPYNHPRPGSTIKVEPIRSLSAIQDIKDILRERNLRDYCLFTLGINTAYRASELLSLTVGQVAYLKAGDVLEIKQRKTHKYRAITLNEAAIEAIHLWLKQHSHADDLDAPLFLSLRSKKSLCVSSVNRLVKKWCREVGLQGHYGSHTLRKTWGYHQRIDNAAPLPLLMKAYGHTTEMQTLTYLYIQEQEISSLYMEMNL